MEIDEIIDKYLSPRLDSECRRLGIPRDFILGVYGCYSKPFEYISYVEEVKKDGKIVGVRIRIGDSNKTAWDALGDFYHEMKHAQNIYKGQKTSELRATLYEKRRMFQEIMNWVFYQIKMLFNRP